MYDGPSQSNDPGAGSIPSTGSAGNSETKGDDSRSIWDVASDVYHGACDVGKEISGGVKWAEDGITSGVHSAEDWVDQESHALASTVADVPVLGTLAESVADNVSMTTEVLGGVVGGATSLVGGVVNAVAHPLDTASGIEALAEHVPVTGDLLRMGHNALNVVEGKESVGEALDHSFNPLTIAQDDAKFWGAMGSAIIDPYKQSIDEGRYGEVAGRAAFDIGSLLIGAGEANAGVKGAEVAADAARATEIAADAARGSEIAADAARGSEVAADAARGSEVAADTARGSEVAEPGFSTNPTEPAPGVSTNPTEPAPGFGESSTQPAPGPGGGEVTNLPPGEPNPYEMPIPKPPKVPDFGLPEVPDYGYEPDLRPGTTAPTEPAPGFSTNPTEPAPGFSTNLTEPAPGFGEASAEPAPVADAADRTAHPPAPDGPARLPTDET
jgi:hypothetical protein